MINGDTIESRTWRCFSRTTAIGNAGHGTERTIAVGAALGITKCFLLVAVARSNDQGIKPTTKEIATALGISTSTVSKHLLAMSRTRWVEATSLPDNKAKGWTVTA